MAAERNRTRVYQPLSVHSWGEWDRDVSKVKSALRQMENGEFGQAAQLADAMGRDDRVEGVFGTRVEGLLGLPMQFEPRGDGRKAKVVAKDVEERFWGMFPESQTAELLQWGLKLGVGIGQLIYERTASAWVPRLETWWPGFVTWRWDTRSFWVQTMDGMVEVIPGDGRWVVYAPYGLERGWMRGAVRRLAIPWLIKQWARRDWARYSEVHGLPARKAKYPQLAEQAEKDRFFDEVAALNAEPTIGLPQGEDGKASFDFELVEAQANTWEGFQQLLAHCDTSIGITVLGGNLSSEVKGGSYAAAKAQDEVRIDRKRFDAETLSTTLHEQALRPFAAFNHGDPALAPFPCWETEPPEDTQAQAQTLSTLGDALTKLEAATANAKVQVDVEAVLEEFSVPVKRRTEPAPVPASEGEADPEDRDEEFPAARAARLDRPQAATSEEPADDAQAYVDGVVDAAARAGRTALAPDVEKVLGAIEQATSFDALRAQLPALLEAMDPTSLSELTRDATLLALLAGRRAVQQET